MEYIYSAMVLHSAGKEISEASVKKVLTAAGVKPDETRIKALTAALEGVDIEEALTTQVAAPVAAAPAAAPATAELEEKKEDEDKKKDKEEKKASEEEAAAGLGALFG